jgi:hypothetical protein
MESLDIEPGIRGIIDDPLQVADLPGDRRGPRPRERAFLAEPLTNLKEVLHPLLSGNDAL